MLSGRLQCTDEETEAQQASVSCPRSSGNLGAELRFGFLVFSPSFPNSTTPRLTCAPEEEGVHGAGNRIVMSFAEPAGSGEYWEDDELGNQTEAG